MRARVARLATAGPAVVVAQQRAAPRSCARAFATALNSKIDVRGGAPRRAAWRGGRARAFVEARAAPPE
jgi:hypothetical protein